MSETKRNVPKLRFPEFTEDWEQRKLGELYERVNERNDGTLGRDKWISVAKMYFQDPDKVQSNNLDTRTYVMQRGDIAFEGHPNNEFKFGRFVLNDIGTGIISELFPIYRPIVRYDLNFWKYAIQLERTMAPIFAKSITSSGNSSNKLDQNHFLQQSITIPTVEEQKVIGSFLENISNLITLHQRKLENLKLKKKALLQKLFPKNGEQFPELRFPGFTDAWEQRKLSDFTERVVRKNGEKSDRPLTISAQDGLVDQREYFNRQVASKDMSNYYLIKNGEFAYNKSYSEGYPFGAVKRLDYYESGALSTLYIVFKLIDTNVLSDFIVVYYMTHLWYGEISKRASEGARNHGLLNISPVDFFQSEMLIPTDVNEQRLIGKFFENFDNLITLHQRKLEHLQLQKKALLQQMFV